LSGVPFDVRFLVCAGPSSGCANGQGLETDTPYVQVGELFFKGTWSDIIGTEMIIGPDEENGGGLRKYFHGLINGRR